MTSENDPRPEPDDGHTANAGITAICDTVDGEVGDGDASDPYPCIRCVSMVDAFENTTGALPQTDGRMGFWVSFSDGTEGAEHQPAPGRVRPNELGNWDNQLRIAGTGHTDWGSGVGVGLNGTRCSDNSPAGCRLSEIGDGAYDASAYDGVLLTIRNYQGDPQRVRVSLPTLAETSVEFGGHCEHGDGCGDAYYIEQQLGPSPVVMHWSGLTQAGWGAAVPFDPSQLTQIRIEIPAGSAYNIAVDDVCFFSVTE